MGCLAQSLLKIIQGNLGRRVMLLCGEGEARCGACRGTADQMQSNPVKSFFPCKEGAGVPYGAPDGAEAFGPGAAR